MRLDEPDGEFKMGLVVTRGKPFDKAIMGVDGKEETAKHMSAEWFKRKNDTSHAWPKNPAFEPHGATDDLPVDSFLLRVEDAELTDAGVKEKWQHPKFKEVFLAKLRGIADKYPQLRAPAKASKRARVAAAGAPAANSEDDLGMLLEANRRKRAETAAMKERVSEEMTAAMDTGVHANPILTAAYGIHVEQPQGGDGSGGAVDAQAVPAATRTATPAVAPQEGLSPPAPSQCDPALPLQIVADTLCESGGGDQHLLQTGKSLRKAIMPSAPAAPEVADTGGPPGPAPSLQCGLDYDAALAINGQDEEAAVVEALRRSRETLGLADTVAVSEAYAEAVRRSLEDAAAEQAVWDIGRAVVASQGFTEQECGADGNCLYRSAARQLREYDFRLGRHRDVRLRVVAHIREHRAHYMEHAHESLVDLVGTHLELEYDEVDLDALLEPCLDLMEEDKHWAESEFELRAIADAFGATVVKVSASPDVALVRYEPDSMSGIGAVADQPVIHLVHYHGLHYRAGFAEDDRAPYAPTAPAARGVAARQLPPRSTRASKAQH